MTQPALILISNHEVNISDSDKIRIWVDADACPRAIKDILIRTAQRLGMELTFVSNQSIPIPQDPNIKLIVVADGADVADNWIAANVGVFDVVITQDIPLAAQVVERRAVAIGPRGELFDDNSVGGRLATRNLMDQLRSAGFETRGPRPLSKKDVQAFANALDRTITRCQNKKSKFRS